MADSFNVPHLDLTKMYDELYRPIGIFQSYFTVQEVMDGVNKNVMASVDIPVSLQSLDLIIITELIGNGGCLDHPIIMFNNTSTSHHDSSMRNYTNSHIIMRGLGSASNTAKLFEYGNNFFFELTSTQFKTNKKTDNYLHILPMFIQFIACKFR